MLSMMLVRTDPALERNLENRTIRDAAAPVHETTEGFGSLISALSIISSNYKVRLQSRPSFPLTALAGGHRGQKQDRISPPKYKCTGEAFQFTPR